MVCLPNCFHVPNIHVLCRVSNYSWGQLLSGSKMCSVSSNWCLFSSKKTMGTVGYIVCLKKRLPSGNICFLFKAPKREWEWFEIDSLSLEHQKEGHKLGTEVVSGLWHTLPLVFPCWEGKATHWVWKFCFSWIFLFILICTLSRTDFCVLVPALLLSQVRPDALWVGVRFSEFCREVCRVFQFHP